MRVAAKRTTLKRTSIRSAVLAALIGLFHWSCAPEEQTPAPESIRPVRYVEVSARGGERVRMFSGAAQAGIQFNISFQVSGRIQKLPVKVGDILRPGGLIAEVDPTDYAIELRRAEASMAEARAAAANANSEYRRTQALYERQNASEGEFEAALAAVEASKANVEAAQSQIDGAKQQLDYCRLTTSMPGVVVDVAVETNETVRTGQTIATLISGRHPEVVVAIPELIIAEINPGMVATVRFDAAQGQPYQGRVTEVAILPTEGLNTYPVTIQLNKAWRDYVGPRGIAIRPGMAVETEFRFPAASDTRLRHVVPPTGVLQDRSGVAMCSLQNRSIMTVPSWNVERLK